MKKSTKAALLSAFVIPGSGHLYLKKYIPGMALAGASLASIYYIMSKSIESALQLVDRIQSGHGQPDIAAIIDLASKQPAASEAHLLNLATTVFVLCWLIGTIDAYRAGLTQEKTMRP